MKLLARRVEVLEMVAPRDAFPYLSDDELLSQIAQLSCKIEGLLREAIDAGDVTPVEVSEIRDRLAKVRSQNMQ